MSGFYEMLGVAEDADEPAIRTAYGQQVARLAGKLRAAESRQQDVAPLESRRAELQEAWSVLGDPVRRRRYDRFRELGKSGLPADPDEVWNAASRSLIDPAAAAALEVVRTLSDLRVGESVEVHLPAAEPEEGVVSRAAVVETGPAVPTRATAVSKRAPLPTREPLPMDRAVSREDMARLFDIYGPTGAFLKAARDLRRLTLEQLSNDTRVAIRFLDAIERDAFAELPGATFVRGYLKLAVRSLECLPEVDEFVDDWMARYHRARG
jgi:curved DNA-binding protein CbpA